MDRVNKILKQKAKADELKSQWQSIYDEVYKYVLPFRGSAYKQDTQDKTNKELYTSIGENSAITFVNRMQQLLTPVNSDFIGLEANRFVNENKEELDSQLEIISDLLNNLKNGSNFDSAISEFYFDLIAGTSCLLVQSGTVKDILKFKTIPFKEYSITEGADGKVNGVFREFKIKKEELKTLWHDVNINNIDEKQEEFKLIEATIYDYEKLQWQYVVINDKNIIVDRYYKNNPFIILRWNKASGEVYGRGVGLTALNDIKTLNKIMEYSLRTLAFQLPIFTATESDVFDEDFLIEPGAINLVKSNDNTNPTIKQLQINGNNDIQQYNINLLEMKIKRTMLDNTIPDDPNKITATEVLQRTSELNTNISSTFGRITVDFVYPLIRRMLEVIQEFGHFREFDIDRIDGYGFKVIIKTPITRQNKQQELQDTIQAIQLLASIDPSSINRFMKVEEMLPYLLKIAGISNSFIRSPEEVEQYDIQLQQMAMTQEQNNINNQIALSNEIEKGKENAKRGY